MTAAEPERDVTAYALHYHLLMIMNHAPFDGKLTQPVPSVVACDQYRWTTCYHERQVQRSMIRREFQQGSVSLMWAGGRRASLFRWPFSITCDTCEGTRVGTLCGRGRSRSCTSWLSDEVPVLWHRNWHAAFRVPVVL